MAFKSYINFPWLIKYFTAKVLGSADRFMCRLGRKCLENFQLDWTFKLIAAYIWRLDIQMFKSSSFMTETTKYFFLEHSSTKSIEELQNLPVSLFYIHSSFCLNLLLLHLSATDLIHGFLCNSSPQVWGRNLYFSQALVDLQPLICV